MSAAFDPYVKWLGIRDPQRPPNHYLLLGLTLFEGDAEVIEAAADRQMGHVRTYQTGPQSEISQRVLNELAAARLCLLAKEKKAAYDALLRSSLGQRQTRAQGFGDAVPLKDFGGSGSGVAHRPGDRPLNMQDQWDDILQ